MSKIILKEESYKIMGACFEVFKRKGFGFAESVYQECLEIEFQYQGISSNPQPKLSLEYRGNQLEQFFKPDFVCYGKIVLEIKAVSKLMNDHRGQTINYLKATSFDLALLVNFGHHPKLEYERFGNQENYKSPKSYITKPQ